MNSRTIRLIGIDVDGTLVGSSGVVDPRVWQSAQRVAAAGIRLALCSGRPAFGQALTYARCLDPSGWHAFQNGASVVHLASSRSRSVALPHDCISLLIAQARASGRVLELYSDRNYVTESTTRWAREHAALLGVPFQPQPLEALSGEPVRAQWLVSPDEAPAVVEEVPAHLEVALSTSPLMPDTSFIGLTRCGVNKGSAMRQIASEYAVDLQQVMYVGDAGNDLSALQIVGHPVAMANADERVLAQARYTVGDVEAAGLVEALELALTHCT